MTPYPPSFGVFSGFQNQVVHTFRLNAYHLTTVVLFFEDIFVYCTHCFSVKRWTKCHIICRIVAIESWLLSNIVPVLTLFFPLLHRIPFTDLEQSQNQCAPSLTFRILPPQFRQVWEEASIPISVRNLIICSSFFGSIKCMNSSYDIREVFKSNWYQGNKGWTFWKRSTSSCFADLFPSAFCCGSISCTDVRLYNLPLVSSSLEIFVRSTKALRFDCIIATCVVVFIHARTLKFRYGTSNIPNALQEKTTANVTFKNFEHSPKAKTNLANTNRSAKSIGQEYGASQQEDEVFTRILGTIRKRSHEFTQYCNGICDASYSRC